MPDILFTDVQSITQPVQDISMSPPKEPSPLSVPIYSTSTGSVQPPADPLQTVFTDLELSELQSLVSTIRLRSEPVLNLAVLVASHVNKPPNFFAHFTHAQFQQLGRVRDVHTFDDLLEAIRESAPVSTQSKQQTVNEFTGRLLMLLTTEEQRRLLFKSSLSSTLLQQLEAVAHAVGFDITQRQSLAGTSSLAPLLFRDNFYTAVDDNFTEIKQRTGAQWNSIDEICEDKLAASDFANYVAEKYRMSEYKGYRSMVINADHYAKLKHYAMQLRSKRSAAQRVVARSASVATVSTAANTDPVHFYGNTLLVWRTLVNEIGDERAHQYLPYVADFALTNTVHTE
jgi:hypothetical protein